MRVGNVEAFLLDLDGVLTPTATVHARAWKRTFDRVMEVVHGPGFEPFTHDDYLLHVDGKPRYDGVRDFLRSRDIHLPEGDRDDEPGFDTVCAVGNMKNAEFAATLESEGVDAYPDTVPFLDAIARQGIAAAVVSSSANARAVLAAAGLDDRFTVVMDGIEARRLGLPGKPRPDTFLEAGRRLKVPPERAAVVEDAVSGVEAGAAGGFGLVVGMDREGDGSELRAAGADLVVAELTALL